MAASVEYVWKTGSKLLRRWLIKLLRKKKLPKDTQWIAGNIINRQWFWCFVQVLNYKVIHLLWRDYRTSNHCFVSISSSYSRILVLLFHVNMILDFEIFFPFSCLPLKWPQKECDVAAVSTWALTQQWLPAPRSLQHAPGGTELTHDPTPCPSHRNAPPHGNEPWPDEPTTQ